MVANPNNPDTKSSAENLLKNIDLKFLFFLDVWDQILGQVDRVTRALQMKNLSLDKAAHLVQGLRNSLQEIRNGELEENFMRASTLASTLQVENTSKRSRKKKRLHLYEGEDDGPNISEKQGIRTNIIQAVDILTTEMNWRYEKVMEFAGDFGFLSLHFMSKTELKKTADLAMKYERDINAVEFIGEISDFKHAALSILHDHLESATTLALLQLIHAGFTT